MDLPHGVRACVCLLQDIGDCRGPQSSLLELSSQVKQKFSKLRMRIQVGCPTSLMRLRSMNIHLLRQGGDAFVSIFLSAK